MLRIWNSRVGFWAVRELGYAVGREEGGFGGSVGSAVRARVVGGMRRRRRARSMAQGVGEGCIVGVGMEGDLGEGSKVVL